MLKTLFAAGLFLAMPIASADTLLLDGINAARDSANLRPARGMSIGRSGIGIRRAVRAARRRRPVRRVHRRPFLSADHALGLPRIYRLLRARQGHPRRRHPLID